MKNLVLTALVAIVVSLVTVQFVAPKSADNAAKKETTYERVMRTKKIRCGWFAEAPFTYFDENTKEHSGLAVDLAKLIAKDLGLEVEFTEQISFATFPQDLKNGRYDMVCGSIFVMPRAGSMDYSTPFAYVPINGYVKADNTNFDKKFDAVDWANVTTAGIDGEGATGAVQKIIPQTKMQPLPQLSSIAEMLMQVSNGKADIGFVMPTVFADFNKNNSGLLKQAQLDKPLYRYAVTFGLPRGEEAFKAVINNAIRQYTVSGELATLHAKYDPAGLIEQPKD